MSEALAQLLAGGLILLSAGIGFAFGYQFGKRRGMLQADTVTRRPPRPRRPRPRGAEELRVVRDEPPERIH